MFETLEKTPVLDLMPIECRKIVKEEGVDLYECLQRYADKEDWIPSSIHLEKMAEKLSLINLRDARTINMDKLCRVVAYLDLFQFFVFLSWLFLHNPGLSEMLLDYSVSHNNLKECNIICQRATLLNAFHNIN